ncbi:MAG: sigma-54 dependent transcriptional regulator [Alistipes sp.]|nr:sigma-54 dependent transcriptional regulator [Alistipes sp.]
MEIQSVKQRFGIIGNNEALNRALEIAIRVAPTDLSVLISGESGVGKEFFPQIIHAYSARKHNKYIAVNCGAIPEGTIDSELFGHEKGSFTGATDSRKGYFEEADKGTIFLDEVAELPLSTQVRLLRVLQTGEFIRVGSSKAQKTDVRVVAATNIDLQEAVNSGRFREDLYYRLNTVPVVVPPLRQRKEDIYLLFRRFATDIAMQYKMPVISLDEGARQLLENYSWPGNIRQLKNVAEQISAIEQSRTITADILRKYLPHTETSPVHIPGDLGGAGGLGNERELLYKIFFDLRADLTELKRMVGELINEKGGSVEIAGLLPSALPYEPYRQPTGAVAPAQPEPEDAVSEDITNEPSVPLTKEQVQRESIVKALRKHNGKRKDAAKELFISERTLYRKIKDLGIYEY